MWYSQLKGPTWSILISDIQAKMWNRLQKSKKMFAHIPEKRPLADPIGPDVWKHLEPLAMVKTWENDNCNKRSHWDVSVTEVE